MFEDSFSTSSSPNYISKCISSLLISVLIVFDAIEIVCEDWKYVSSGSRECSFLAQTSSYNLRRLLYCFLEIVFKLHKSSWRYFLLGISVSDLICIASYYFFLNLEDILKVS